MIAALIFLATQAAEPSILGQNREWSEHGRAEVMAAACDLLASKIREQSAIQTEAAGAHRRLMALRAPTVASTPPTASWPEIAVLALELGAERAATESRRSETDERHLRTIYRSFCPSRP